MSASLRDDNTDPVKPCVKCIPRPQGVISCTIFLSPWHSLRWPPGAFSAWSPPRRGSGPTVAQCMRICSRAPMWQSPRCKSRSAWLCPPQSAGRRSCSGVWQHIYIHSQSLPKALSLCHNHPAAIKERGRRYFFYQAKLAQNITFIQYIALAWCNNATELKCHELSFGERVFSANTLIHNSNWKLNSFYWWKVVYMQLTAHAPKLTWVSILSSFSVSRGKVSLRFSPVPSGESSCNFGAARQQAAAAHHRAHSIPNRVILLLSDHLQVHNLSLIRQII